MIVYMDVKRGREKGERERERKRERGRERERERERERRGERGLIYHACIYAHVCTCLLVCVPH